MQSGVCLPCDSADAWENWSRGSQTGLLVGCIVFALFVLAFAFFQPLIPALERAADAFVAGIKTLASRMPACACCRTSSKLKHKGDEQQQHASAEGQLGGTTASAAMFAADEGTAAAATAPVAVVVAPQQGAAALTDEQTSHKHEPSSGVSRTTSSRLGHRHKSVRLGHQAALDHAGMMHASVAVVSEVSTLATVDVLLEDGNDDIQHEEGVGGQLDFMDVRPNGLVLTLFHAPFMRVHVRGVSEPASRLCPSIPTQRNAHSFPPVY